MYKLYSDTSKLFECDINVDGASLKDSKARLVVETNGYSILFNGDIDSKGKCKIPIKKLKGLIEDDSKGVIRLEVIAEDTYFTPWESKFEIDYKKKVTVEVIEDFSDLKTKKKLTIENISGDVSDKQKVHIANILKLLVIENIDISNISYKKNRLSKIIAVYNKYNPISESIKSEVIDTVITELSKKIID
jgi:hypothetical protein